MDKITVDSAELSAHVSSYMKGASVRDIAKALEISVPTARRLLVEGGAVIRPRGRYPLKSNSKHVPGVVGMPRTDEEKEELNQTLKQQHSDLVKNSVEVEPETEDTEVENLEVRRGDGARIVPFTTERV